MEERRPYCLLSIYKKNIPFLEVVVNQLLDKTLLWLPLLVNGIITPSF